MNRRGIVVLCVIVAGLLGGLYWLVRPTPEPERPPTPFAGVVERARTNADAPPPAPSAPAVPSVPAAPRVPSGGGDSEPPAWTPSSPPSPRQYARENPDGTTTLVTDHTGEARNPDAKPAPFSGESLAAVQRAGQPAITECAKALPPGTTGSVGVVAQITSQGGKIAVSGPEVRPAGFTDEAFVACVGGKLAESQIDAPGQGDASYKVMLTYRIK